MSGYPSGVPEGTHGHHSSRLANAADPRIDSDRDNREAPMESSGLESSRHATGIHEPAHHGAGTQEGAFNTGANRGLSGAASKTDGPHSSNTLNKADPRVDSDRDRSKNMGFNPSRDATTGTGRTTGNTLGSSTGTRDTTTGNTLGSSTGTRDTTTGNTLGSSTGTRHTTTGNTLGSSTGARDTTSDTLGSSTGAYGTTTGNTLGSSTGTHGRTNVPEGTHGPHSSHTANAADPRVDSDRDHRAAHGKTTGTTGTTGGLGGNNVPHTRSAGPAPNTAGPHKSDMMNKLDPRVDSDLDGSKTLGADKTHTR